MLTKVKQAVVFLRQFITIARLFDFNTIFRLFLRDILRQTV